MSIEIRNLNSLFHFCINCLNEIISSIPFHVVEFEKDGLKQMSTAFFYQLYFLSISAGRCVSL